MPHAGEWCGVEAMCLSSICTLLTQHTHTWALQKRLNITKTVRKTPINLELQRTGAAVDDSHKKKDPKYDHEDRFVSAREGVGGKGGGWPLAATSMRAAS